MTTDSDAILVGGPSDQTVVTAGAAALVELEIDGLIHRYIRTRQRRSQNGDGVTLTVYNYDGEVAPGGGDSGSESGPDRIASPLAAGQAEELPSGPVSGASAAGRS